MHRYSTQTIFHSFVYGGASVLLALDLFYLIKSLFQNNFVPVLPIVAGIFISTGLLLVVYAEHQARKQARGELRRLSRVAHQLESPLKNLQEDLQQLVAQSDRLPAEARMKLKRMDTKSHILLDNIRDVFLMLQAQQGKITQDLKTYDVCKLVQEAVDRVRPLASARNVEILQKAHCDHAAVAVDRSLFFIALGHLLENGILYTLTPGILNISIVKGTSQVRIVVQDRGVGVKEKDAPAILLPFARGDKADQFDPDGIGVGLTLASYIVKEFGGSFNWRPRENAAGTEFEIRLPLIQTT
ncbi:MAG: HAMP domain-containing sensor histidine kinase [Candidatus Andersenbacteria bacterium]